ncbi:chitin-binding protein [Streptomyces zinciresistens K42]|uniref:Chitin-binding protein n=1 Tax=Streptomyces zinciresistens K42 TaxID=700597 RepID=G2GHH6_9ACTN|nr:lytic polysaccharide monooxygenase [Streptomyces zinciresistens]EGX57041.1 chitin-binding protein [Streptomyces zinciresistens K42]
MPARRKAATVAALGLAPLALAALAAAPASAHGSMGDPVSRVAQCYAEGPENPKSAACRAAVAAGGTQALYDWNGIRIGDANGRHEQLIPDGRLCSANNEAFKGLDLARTDWPTTAVGSGRYTFRYRVTAPHRGTFKVYITKQGYDPAKPLAWSDLDMANPVATAPTDPKGKDGYYVFSGSLPQRSGKQMLYGIWQRSDSPEAFYTCSDVTFGGSAGSGSGSGGASGSGASGASGSSGASGASAGSAGKAAPAPSASAPTEKQIAAGAGKSTVGHNGHGGGGAAMSAAPTAPVEKAPSAAPADRPRAAGAGGNLAETGGSGGTTYLAVGGAATLALGSAVLFASVRRRAAAGARRGR